MGAKFGKRPPNGPPFVKSGGSGRRGGIPTGAHRMGPLVRNLAGVVIGGRGTERALEMAPGKIFENGGSRIATWRVTRGVYVPARTQMAFVPAGTQKVMGTVSGDANLACTVS